MISSMWAVALRHLRVWRRDINLILAGLYWPLLDIIIWGFLGSWIAQSQSILFHNYETAALLGILLWQIVGRGCNLMVTAFTEELWLNNVVNLFSLPLKTVEWMGGAVIFTAIIMSITSLFCMFAIYMLYNVSIFSIFTVFLLFCLPLFLCCIWLGFTCLQIIVTFGKRGVELGFVIGWFLMPFSGAYYPVDILPQWGQAISVFLPMSYLFQGMRGYVMHQQNPLPLLIKGSLLSVLYALCSILIFIYCFNKSKQKGLARLAD